MRSDILARYADLPLPRYTSYPTAPHFKPAESGLYRQWLTAVPTDSVTSLYLHVPFCRSMCWYCGCHTTITARDEPIARYLAALRVEIELVGACVSCPASGPTGRSPGSPRCRGGCCTRRRRRWAPASPTTPSSWRRTDMAVKDRDRFSTATRIPRSVVTVAAGG